MPRLTTTATVLLFTWISNAYAAPSPELWSYWNDSQEDSSQRLDHSDWQAFLEAYVSPGADDINRVNYDAAAQGRGRKLLSGYLEQLQALDPRTLSRTEQLPYWINLYNALTLELVLRHPRKPGILRMGKGLFSIGPWDDAVATISGQELTLNDIEHRILRPIWQDHRIHFAVNCASLGCPNLRRQAFTAVNTEALMASAESDYINHSRGVSFTDRGKVQLSSIFKWYRADFAADEKQLLEYLASHHSTLGEQLSSYDGKVRYDYDWGLNSQNPR